MHLAVNHRIERRFGGHRVQTIGHRHTQLQLRLARLPRLQRLGHRKRKMPVQILERLQADIIRQLALRKNTRRFGRDGEGAKYCAQGNENMFHDGYEISLRTSAVAFRRANLGCQILKQASCNSGQGEAQASVMAVTR